MCPREWNSIDLRNWELDNQCRDRSLLNTLGALIGSAARRDLWKAAAAGEIWLFAIAHGTLLSDSRRKTYGAQFQLWSFLPPKKRNLWEYDVYCRFPATAPPASPCCSGTFLTQSHSFVRLFVDLILGSVKRDVSWKETSLLTNLTSFTTIKCGARTSFVQLTYPVEKKMRFIAIYSFDPKQQQQPQLTQIRGHSTSGHVV